MFMRTDGNKQKLFKKYYIVCIVLHSTISIHPGMDIQYQTPKTLHPHQDATQHNYQHT